MPTYRDPGNPGEVRCAFCGKTRSQVRKLVQGINGIFICDECIDACEDIIHDSDALEYGDVESLDPEQVGEATSSPLPIAELPTPHQIYDQH